GQIQQYIDTHTVTGFLDRIGRIAEEGHQVAHSGIKLFFTLRASTLDNRQHITLLFQHWLTGQRVAYDLAAILDRHRLATLDLTTLELSQDVRHADVIKDRIVRTQRARQVFVEATQIGIQPVVTTNTSNHGQVRWRSTKPHLGI